MECFVKVADARSISAASRLHRLPKSTLSHRIRRRMLDALKAGYFYSSTGPELRDVRVEGGRIKVECSPARAIVVTGRGARGVRLNVPSGAESADLPLDKFEGTGYCRVTVVDAAGRRAWTNPIWLD